MGVKIPENVNVQITDSTVVVSGKLGKLERAFPAKAVKILRKDGQIEVQASPALTGSIESHIKNMMTGVTDGYVIKLQIVYSHFPITLEIKGAEVWVKNFLGEKQPRKAKIMGGTKIDSKPPVVTVSGPSKEAVGQTVANLRSALRIRNRDSRVFQDGLYPIDE